MLVKIGQLLEKGISKFELLLNYLAVALLSIMVLLGTADVIARYFFNSPIKGALEISGLLMASAIFLILGYVQAKKSNITLELLVNRYPRLARFVADICILMLTIGLFAVITWQSIALAYKDMDYGRLIENIYLPVYPFKLILAFGAALVCLEALIQLVRLVYNFKRRVGAS